jgi:hypothetical protein
MPAPQVFSLLDGGSSNVETAFWSTDPTPTVDYTGGSARLVIRMQSWFATLGRSDPRRYNAAEQGVQYPDDRGLDFVPSMVDKTVSFIPKSRLR